MIQQLKQKNRIEEKDKKDDDVALAVKREGTTDLSGFKFIDKNSKLDFGNMIVLKATYGYRSIGPWDAETITEVVLEDEKTKKKYYCTFASWETKHDLYITNKPLKDTYCSICDNESDEFDILIKNIVASYYEEQYDENELDEDSSIRPIYNLICYLDKLKVEQWDKNK